MIHTALLSEFTSIICSITELYFSSCHQYLPSDITAKRVFPSIYESELLEYSLASIDSGALISGAMSSSLASTTKK